MTVLFTNEPFTLTPADNSDDDCPSRNEQERDLPPWKFAKIVARTLNLLASLTFYVPEKYTYLHSFKPRKMYIRAIGVSVLQIRTFDKDSKDLSSFLIQ